MKKTRIFLFDTLKTVSVLLIASILAVLLLFAVYSLPADKMTNNARKSSEIFSDEGSYKKFFDSESYQLDNFTDATMINEAIFDYDGDALEAAMLSYHGGFNVGGLVNYLNGNGNLYSYSRYWHGYLIFLKPLLLIFSIKGIRILNLILQVLLLFGICFALWKKQKKMIIPYLVSLLFINPFVISQSMQFSCIYYLMNIALLIIVLFYDKLKEKGYLKFAFLIFGILTSFFDLLTYPSATLTVPLIAVIWFDESETFKDKFLTIFKLCAFWAIGYFGFWILKWAIGSIITHQNLFKDALSQAQTRIDGDISYAPSKILVYFAFLINIKPLINIKNAVILCVIAICMCYLIVKYKKEYKIAKSQIFSFVIIALIPIVWQLVLHNHSYEHYWFTFRAYVGTIFALLSIFAYGFKDIKLLKGETYEKENSSDNSMLQWTFNN